MKIAVLMPAYNAAAYIGDALASLLRQRDAATLDIVVVDDGSTDDTVAIVEQLAAPEVRLLRTRMACGGGPQCGARGARTGYRHRGLARRRRSFAARPHGRGGRDFQWRRCGHADRHDPHLPRHGCRPADARVRRGSATFRSAQLGGVMLSAALTRRVRAFDLEMQQGEDGDYIVRALELQPRYRLSDEIVVYYRRHGHNLTLDSAGLRRGLVLVAMKAARRRRPAPRPFRKASSIH